jgi:hypothetical protein
LEGAVVNRVREQENLVAVIEKRARKMPCAQALSAEKANARFEKRSVPMMAMRLMGFAAIERGGKSAKSARWQLALQSHDAHECPRQSRFCVAEYGVSTGHSFHA